MIMKLTDVNCLDCTTKKKIISGTELSSLNMLQWETFSSEADQVWIQGSLPEERLVAVRDIASPQGWGIRAVCPNPDLSQRLR